MSDEELYRRGAATLVASWAACARGTTGARVLDLPGAAAAVFARGPERGVYNNALPERGLPAGRRAAALDAIEDAYARAGVERFAVWAHEGDAALRGDLEGRGYATDESTRAMGAPLAALRVPEPRVAVSAGGWAEYLGVLDVPDGLLAGVDPAAFHVLVVRVDGVAVAAAMAFDHDGDCGIYNVATVERARGRGLGTALTARHLLDARERGCRTASLQSTPMAERVYARVGFRDLGRIVEYAPAGP